MFKKTNKQASRERRHLRVRKKVTGTAERPRLSVYRSEKNIYAQIIDDVKGVTLVSSSSLDNGFEGNTGIGMLPRKLAKRSPKKPRTKELTG